MTEEMKTIEIQEPTIGRVVLYRSADNTLTFPAMVQSHDGEGIILLSTCSPSARYHYDVHHGADEHGQPLPGHWCYPPMTRNTITVQKVGD